MTLFRKKPVVIEAVQFTGDVGAPEIVALDVGCSHDAVLGVDVLLIHTLEGVHQANPGDWVIRGVKGELYPCKPDIFEMTYETVEEPLGSEFEAVWDANTDKLYEP
jgi:hypothetical protein